MSAIRIHCPNKKCKALLQVPLNMTHQRMRCAACGKSFIVPITPASRRKAS